MSKLDSILGAMEDYISGCRSKAFSASKIEVERDRIEEFIAELRTKYPDEVKRAQRVIANHDAIIKDAEKQAHEMVEDTKRKIERMVNEHDIVKQATAIADDIVMQARKQAEGIISSARKDADDITTGAISYTDNLLSNIEGVLVSTLRATQSDLASFTESCENSLKQVRANREELRDDSAQ